MSTYLELQDFALGDDFDTGRRASAKLFVNQALGRLHRALRLPTIDARAIVTTAPATNVYSLPADFVTLEDDEAVLYGTDVLEPYDISDFDQLPAVSGTPTSFALSEDLILLYPNPDAAYDLTMRYRRVQTLTADGDVPILGADMHPYLGWYARAKLYLLTDDPDMHNAIMATLPRELQGENLAAGQLRVPQVRQVPGQWSRLPTGLRTHNPQGHW
jgi:hypothetical protein